MITNKVGFGAINSSAIRGGMQLRINELHPDKALHGTSITVVNAAPEILGIMVSENFRTRTTALLADSKKIIVNFFDENIKNIKTKAFPTNKMIPHYDLVGWSKKVQRGDEEFCGVIIDRMI